MIRSRRGDLARLLAIALAVCLLALQHPASIGGGPLDPDETIGPTGPPLPRPDSPREAIAFRPMQWRHENGWVPENGLIDRRRPADPMPAHPQGPGFSRA